MPDGPYSHNVEKRRQLREGPDNPWAGVGEKVRATHEAKKVAGMVLPGETRKQNIREMKANGIYVILNGPNQANYQRR